MRVVFAFMSRLPVGAVGQVADGALARAAVLFPIVGLVIGGLGGLPLWLAHMVGLPSILAAGIGLGGVIVLTGALHEDGLADTADGLGLHREPAQALEIMRDSRIGTFGVLALIFAIAFRWGAIAFLTASAPVLGIIAIVIGSTISRAYLPAMMALLPPARDDGMSRSAGRPSSTQWIAAAVLGVGVTAALLDWRTAVAVVLASALVVAVFGGFVKSRLGGQTGDTLGAAQQIGEVVALLAIAAMMGGIS